MASAKRSLTTLLIGAGILYLGNGLQIILLPLRAELEGFTTTMIGIMGTAYFAGFVYGCILGPAVVKRVGHIRAFAGFAALAAATVLAYPLALDPIAWCALRAFAGICLAVLSMVVESWLNEMSSNKIRGAVLSIYVIVANLVTIGGQLIINLYDVAETALFTLAAMMVCLSLVPLSLTSTAAPKPIAEAKVRIGKLYRLSPAGFVGCLVVGIAEGAFWAMGPVFAQERGLSVFDITLFMSAFMVGGTISQWPIGSLSDKMDRRLVIAGCALGTVGTGIAIATITSSEPWIVFGLATLHGAFMFPLYALCLAHANDFAPNEALVETSSGLLLIYAIGAVIGPLAAAPLMEQDSGYLFLMIVAILGLLALFLVYRSLRRPIEQAVERVEFVAVTKTTPSVYALEQEDEE